MGADYLGEDGVGLEGAPREEDLFTRGSGNFHQLLAQRGRSGAHRNLSILHTQVRGEVLAQRGGRNIRVTVGLRHGLRHGRGRLRQRRVRRLVRGELERVIIARTGDVSGDGFQVWANHASHFRACAFAAGAKAGG